MPTSDSAQPIDAAVAILARWQEAGGIWRVIGRTNRSVTVSLCQCTGGEEVDRIISADPALIDYLAGRNASDDLS